MRFSKFEELLILADDYEETVLTRRNTLYRTNSTLPEIPLCSVKRDDRHRIIRVLQFYPPESFSVPAHLNKSKEAYLPSYGTGKKERERHWNSLEESPRV